MFGGAVRFEAPVYDFEKLYSIGESKGFEAVPHTLDSKRSLDGADGEVYEFVAEVAKKFEHTPSGLNQAKVEEEGYILKVLEADKTR
jgi:hypothetical protein